jgi:AcrR family transcriptional regulator
METGISAEVSRGRPRDAAKREAILAAAYELVLRHGYVKVTTAQIASAAGAGKQTIYRWWPTKAELVLDALEHWAEHSIDLPAKGAPLRDFLARVCDGAMRAGRVLIEPRRDALRESLRAMGMEAADDRETLMRAIYGALWYRLLLDEPLDEAFIDAMTDLAERSLRC